MSTTPAHNPRTHSHIYDPGLTTAGAPRSGAAMATAPSAFADLPEGTIVNLTPHAMTLYPAFTPDRIQTGTIRPLMVIPSSEAYPQARLGEAVVGPAKLGFRLPVPVNDLAFGPAADPAGMQLPEPRPGVFWLTSLVVGLASERPDVLVPHDYVRDLEGRIIGTRRLGRVAPQSATPATTDSA
ncbi:hypothetical protein GCM10009765_23610 [Fodinicola feengrottensis]|uniref:Uncharacterized protein n=1 Tax=Fodinicola feengrottensis TaxID=435914 RepID=A0ABN2GMM6_9ACTN